MGQNGFSAVDLLFSDSLLDEFVRKKLAALGKQLLRCSTTGTPDRYVPVGDLDRSPLIKEPLNKSYGVSVNPEACRCKAQREANGLSPWQGLHQSRRFRRRGRCMLHGSPYGAFSAIRTRRCDFLAGYSMPAKSRLDSVPRWKPGIPIGLVQRFPGYCYASAGDRSTLFAIFPLSFVPFVQYAG